MTDKTDRVLLVDDQAGGLAYVRHRDGGLEVGNARLLRDGQPMAPSEELVALTPKEGSPWFDVDVGVATGAHHRSGPAQVATASYRSGWDVLWGSDKKNNMSN